MPDKSLEDIIILLLKENRSCDITARKNLQEQMWYLGQTIIIRKAKRRVKWQSTLVACAGRCLQNRKWRSVSHSGRGVVGKRWGVLPEQSCYKQPQLLPSRHQGQLPAGKCDNFLRLITVPFELGVAALPVLTDLSLLCALLPGSGLGPMGEQGLWHQGFLP